MEDEVKCPECNGEKFGELRLADYRIYITKEGDIEDSDFNDYTDYSLVYCRDCSCSLVHTKKGWIKATEEEEIENVMDLLRTVLSRDIKAEDFDKFKKIMMLEKLS